MWSVLLSSFRPARRHASKLTTVHGSDSLIESRGYASSSSKGDTHDTKMRDLYLVLDDRKDGFGIHKLDLSFNMHARSGRWYAATPPRASNVPRDPRNPPRPRAVQFAAVGSCIVATGTAPDSCIGLAGLDYLPTDIVGVLIYNTKTAALTVRPNLPEGLVSGGYKATAAIGNSLYMLGFQGPFMKWHSGGSLAACTVYSFSIVFGSLIFFGVEPWTPKANS